MSDLPTVEEITSLTGLLAPGIIILWTRSRFRDTVPPNLADKVANYAIASIAYGAASYPVFYFNGGVELPSWLWQFLLTVALPLVVGIAFVFFDRSERFYELTERLGLRPVHHTPTAWDYTFRKREPSFALVHLNDGSEVAGAWIERSFASSTSGDRDIYLEQMFQIGEDGKWSEVVPARSILICGGSIRMVEFIKGGSDE
ncbi:DUF6338 family protein [Sphingomonas carotinifaciens]|uniref:DUF6338 family protein n=1 Tax=Sphingomonas carotinifaciens TaxID=1166323 RepID=UPI00399F8829